MSALAEASLKVRWTEEYLRNINAVLRDPSTPGIGGYCVAVVSLTVAQELPGALPDRALLEAAARCRQPRDAHALAMDWIRAGKRKERSS